MRNLLALAISAILHGAGAYVLFSLAKAPAERPPQYQDMDLEILALPPAAATPITSDEEALSSPPPAPTPEPTPEPTPAPEGGICPG